MIWAVWDSKPGARSLPPREGLGMGRRARGDTLDSEVGRIRIFSTPVAKQASTMSNPGHFWPLILILIPICIFCRGLNPRERFPLTVGTTEGINHCTPPTSPSPGTGNSPSQGWAALCCLSKIQACDHPTDTPRKGLIFHIKL